MTTYIPGITYKSKTSYDCASDKNLETFRNIEVNTLQKKASSLTFIEQQNTSHFV